MKRAVVPRALLVAVLVAVLPAMGLLSGCNAGGPVGRRLSLPSIRPRKDQQSATTLTSGAAPTTSTAKRLSLPGQERGPRTQPTKDWEVPVDCTGCAIAADEEFVYLLNGTTRGTAAASTMTAYRIGDGSKAWSLSVPVEGEAITPAGPVVLAHSGAVRRSTPAVAAIDRATGQVLWNKPSHSFRPEGLRESTALLSNYDTSTTINIDLRTGQQQWSAGGGLARSCDDLAVLGGSGRPVQVVRLSDGSKAWDAPRAVEAFCDQKFVYLGTETGIEVRRRADGSQVRSQPASQSFIAVNGWVLVGGATETYGAEADGARHWTYPGAYSFNAARPAGPDKAVILTQLSGGHPARGALLDLTSGKALKWVDTSGLARIADNQHEVFRAGGFFAVANGQATLYELNTLQPRWSVPSTGESDFSNNYAFGGGRMFHTTKTALTSYK